jgi:di/tricarboxylate transporter
MYGAVTANQGAYGLTRALAELTLLGIGLQAAVLWGARGIPRWAPVVVSLGCALFLAFWDVDNLMFVGTICLLAGFVPMSKALRQSWNQG